MPKPGFRTVSLRTELVEEVEAAIAAGKTKRFAVHKVAPAIELATRDFLAKLKADT